MVAVPAAKATARGKTGVGGAGVVVVVVVVVEVEAGSTSPPSSSLKLLGAPPLPLPPPLPPSVLPPGAAAAPLYPLMYPIVRGSTERVQGDREVARPAAPTSAKVAGVGPKESFFFFEF